jgi:hypothetical protein
MPWANLVPDNPIFGILAKGTKVSVFAFDLPSTGRGAKDTLRMRSMTRLCPINDVS